MLKPKLLRLDESLIQELEQLAQSLSKKEYISFSALVRKLIKLGMKNMETESFIESIKKVSNNVHAEKDRLLLLVKKDMKRMADSGCKYCVHYPETFRQLVANAIEGCEYGDKSRVDFNTYHEMLNYIMTSLKKEGFKVSASFKTIEDDGCLTGLYFNIEW